MGIIACIIISNRYSCLADYPWGKRIDIDSFQEGEDLTIVLVCPQCRNEQAYENSELDTSKEISCSACGFSDLPTAFELARKHEKKSWQITKIVIIVLVGIAFALVGLSIITLAAFYLPLILVPVIVVLLYRRWTEKQAKKN